MPAMHTLKKVSATAALLAVLAVTPAQAVTSGGSYGYAGHCWIHNGHRVCN